MISDVLPKVSSVILFLLSLDSCNKQLRCHIIMCDGRVGTIEAYTTSCTTHAKLHWLFQFTCRPTRYHNYERGPKFVSYRATSPG